MCLWTSANRSSLSDSRGGRHRSAMSSMKNRLVRPYEQSDDAPLRGRKGDHVFASDSALEPLVSIDLAQGVDPEELGVDFELVDHRT